MKILWVGDAIVMSGFSVVTHNICNIISQEHDLSVLGIRYDGSVKNTYPYYVYPANIRGDIYGYEIFRTIVEKEEPDIIILFNDLEIISRYLDFIPDKNTSLIVPFFPMNYKYIDEKLFLKLSNYNISDVLVYTEAASSAFRDFNPSLTYHPMYHGVSRNVYFPIEDAKAESGFEDNFVVGSIMSNTYRKRPDILLEAFSIFANDKKNVRLLLQTSSTSGSFNIRAMAKYFGIIGKVVFGEAKLTNDKFNVLYNIFDVNVNTSLGEGFGLPLLEGAACKCPIICTKDPNLVDIWGDSATYIDPDKAIFIPECGCVGLEPSVSSLVDALNKYYNDIDFRFSMGEAAYARSLMPQFSWYNIGKNVLCIINSVYSKKITLIS